MELFARMNNEYEIDWNDEEQLKWYMYINDDLDISNVYNIIDINQTYFSSRGVCLKALNKFEGRIKKLYLNN